MLLFYHILTNYKRIAYCPVILDNFGPYQHIGASTVPGAILYWIVSKENSIMKEQCAEILLESFNGSSVVVAKAEKKRRVQGVD